MRGAKSRGKAPAGPSHAERSLWFSANPSKRFVEVLWLAYSPFWMAWFLGILIPLKLYEHFDALGYTLTGAAMALPCLLLPLAFDRPADRDKPLGQQFWLVGNVWIAIYSFIGNYFWTHYFYQLLGASYTFPCWELNKVPVTCYLATHAYFCFYHALANVLMRRVKHASAAYGPVAQTLCVGLVVFTLAYATAYMETFTIAHFPYYVHKNKERMYTIGSLFYAIYFFVSFPLFYRVAEERGTGRQWNVWEAALDSLGAGMLCTVLLDGWRLAIGGLNGEEDTGGLPWL